MLARLATDGTGELIQLDILNPSDRLAFFVQLRLTDGQGDDVLPVIWSDNYVSLLPGERSTVRARVPAGTPRASSLTIEARGMNVGRQTAAVTRGTPAGA